MTSSFLKDHPRVCGEKENEGSRRHYKLGSPPRMRGKESGLGCGGRIPRITPAYAGKSPEKATHAVRLQDHPRVCGEKNALPAAVFFGEGSPPRMRGKAVFRVALCIGVGITPAYAGKSLL